MTGLDWLARLRCRVVVVPLGPGPEPEQVLRSAAGSDGLVALIGEWAGGGALLAAEPLLVLAPDADQLDSLGVQPQVTGIDPDVVGGGWFGWLAYDGPSRLAFYDHVLRYRDGQWFFEALWSAERDGLLHARREECAALLDIDVPARWSVGEFGGADRTTHLRAVEQAVELIRAGQLYQVNVCTRLGAAFTGSAAGLFADVSSLLRPRFGAYVEAGSRAVVSLSPELFVARRGKEVTTAPIKGTWPRPDGDAAGAAALRASAKDVAENVMIVDLMRNDLGRVCEPGSVRATTLLDVQPHPGLWHLVSTVGGRLRDGLGDDALLHASFPPGSVTGAPKQAAVAAIAELEDVSRGAYTGAIGFASPSWGAGFSVAIRTFELASGRIALGVGGGVTADSVPMLEWHECLHKAAPLIAAARSRLARRVEQAVVEPSAAQLAGGLLETVLAIDGVPLRADDHVARLDRSCRELYSAAAPPGLINEIRLAAQAISGRSAIRVVVRPDGGSLVTASPAGVRPVVSTARLVHDRRGLWRHKWADRGYLAEQEDGELVPLFVGADGTLLETSRGNLFLLDQDGTLVTQPLRDDLLPGITRRALLDLARDEGRRTQLRPITVGDLQTCAAFWTSSLSLAVPIASLEGKPLLRADAEIARFAAALVRLANGRFVR